MADKTSRYRQLLQQPQVRALLNTIRYAEGTAGPAGYQTMFGGGQFSDMSRHPNKVVRTDGYASAAAGAYQYLPGTWQTVASQLGLKRFGPEEQDIGALKLIERRGALDPFLRGEKFGTVINKLAPEWASLPTAGGGSYYGQPSKELGDLYRYYEQQKQKVGTAPAPLTAQQPEQRSVEQILSSALGLGQKPELDATKAKTQDLLGAIKSSIVQSLVPSIINPTGLIGLP